MLEQMPASGRIKFTLQVVTIHATESCPSRSTVSSSRYVEPVGEQYAKKIADHVSIVEVIPDEYLDANTCSPDQLAQSFAKPALEFPIVGKCSGTA